MLSCFGKLKYNFSLNYFSLKSGFLSGVMLLSVISITQPLLTDSIKNKKAFGKDDQKPITGFVGFYDHYWNDKFSSTIGYSFVEIDNSNGQAPNAFRMGEYALTNLIYTPVRDVIFELQLQYLNRKNFSDGWTTTDPRIQFSFRFNFSQKFYYELNTTK